MRGNRVRLAIAMVAVMTLAVGASPSRAAGQQRTVGQPDAADSLLVLQSPSATSDATPTPSSLAAFGLGAAASPRASSAPVPHPIHPGEKPVADEPLRMPAPTRLALMPPRLPKPTPQPPPEQVDCQVLKCIALTFDDGPGEYTNGLLDQLAAQNVKATFFLVGVYVHPKADVVRRMAAEGHAIGDHTWSHQDLNKIAPEAAQTEIERGALTIQEVTGQRPVLLRPPYGSFTKGKTPENGMAIAMWSVDTLDWKSKDTKLAYQAAVGGAKRNAVILMHDVHPTSVAAVPYIIQKLRLEGYTFVTLPQLFGGHIAPGTVYTGQR